MKILLKKNFAPKESEFLPLRAVSKGKFSMSELFTLKVHSLPLNMSTYRSTRISIYW